MNDRYSILAKYDLSLEREIIFEYFLFRKKKYRLIATKSQYNSHETYTSENCFTIINKFMTL